MAGGLASLPSSNNHSTGKFIGKSRILGPKWLHLPTLTIGLLGVSIFWSVEMAYASPYLLSLGLTKSSIAIVFLAGPLSGLIMQPVIGILADTTTSRFGRRRPWMLAGTVITVLAMLLLGYTRSFASIFTGWNNASNDRLTIALAVVAIYLVDFSINAVMAVDRALIVDTLPPSGQASGSAWAARMHVVGSMAGFFVGSVHLTELLPFLGNTQLQILSLLVSALLLVGHTLTCVCVKEKVLVQSQRKNSSVLNHPAMREVREMWSTVKSLPSTIRQIFAIQFFASMAWFPLMFYGTLYIGEIYKRSTPLSSNATSAEMESRDAEGARLGSRALFFSALLSLFCTLLLPLFIKASGNERPLIPTRLTFGLSSLWTVGHLVVGLCMLAATLTNSLFWATVLFALTGIAGAISMWAPFALLGEAILESSGSSSAENIHLENTGSPHHQEAGEEREGLLSAEDGLGSDEEKDVLSEKPSGGLSAKAGIILGLHNVFIVIPQFIVTGISAVIFAIFDPAAPAAAAQSGVETHSNSLAYVYRFGGTSALVAFVLCWRFARYLQKVA